MIEIKKEAMMGAGEAIYYTLETTRFWRLEQAKLGDLVVLGRLGDLAGMLKTLPCRIPAYARRTLNRAKKYCSRRCRAVCSVPQGLCLELLCFLSGQELARWRLGGAEGELCGGAG
jgi:hypothetical protein